MEPVYFGQEQKDLDVTDSQFQRFLTPEEVRNGFDRDAASLLHFNNSASFSSRNSTQRNSCGGGDPVNKDESMGTYFFKYSAFPREFDRKEKPLTREELLQFNGRKSTQPQRKSGPPLPHGNIRDSLGKFFLGQQSENLSPGKIMARVMEHCNRDKIVSDLEPVEEKPDAGSQESLNETFYYGKGIMDVSAVTNIDDDSRHNETHVFQSKSQSKESLSVDEHFTLTIPRSQSTPKKPQGTDRSSASSRGTSTDFACAPVRIERETGSSSSSRGTSTDFAYAPVRIERETVSSSSSRGTSTDFACAPVRIVRETETEPNTRNTSPNSSISSSATSASHAATQCQLVPFHGPQLQHSSIQYGGVPAPIIIQVQCPCSQNHHGTTVTHAANPNQHGSIQSIHSVSTQPAPNMNQMIHMMPMMMSIPIYQTYPQLQPTVQNSQCQCNGSCK